MQLGAPGGCARRRHAIGRLREEVLVGLRPDYRIHGTARDGFHFTPKPGVPVGDPYAFRAAGVQVWDWHCRNAPEAGIRLYGDAKLHLFQYPYRPFVPFVIEAVRAWQSWIRPSDGCTFAEHTWAAAKGWSQLLASCAEKKTHPHIRPKPRFSRYVHLCQGGNEIIAALQGSSGPLLFFFQTS